MKRHPSYSSKRFILFVSLIFIIPLSCLLLLYNSHQVSALNTELEKTSRDMMRLYQEKLETDISRIERQISEYWANDTAHTNLHLQKSHVDVHLSTYEILGQYRTLSSLFDTVGSMFICVPESGLYRSIFLQSYSFDDKDAMKVLAESIAEDIPGYKAKGWFDFSAAGRSYLVRVLGIFDTYSVCFLDLEETIPHELRLVGDNNQLLYADRIGQPLTQGSFAQQNGIAFRSDSDGYYISGTGSRFFIVQSPLRGCDIFMVYMMPYLGFWQHMGGMNLLFLVMSAVVLAAVAAAYLILLRAYFRPMQTLITTMNRVRSGDVDAKIHKEYNVSEFAQVKDTFNGMLDTIKELKIAAYEQRLQHQQTQLQYLWLQIKPHFYLGCLKNLYGMIEQKKYRETQHMITNVSEYMRFIFQDNQSLVTAGEELRHVQNYLTLQAAGMMRKPVVTIDCDPAAGAAQIPSHSIQTFVENAFKHGQRPETALVLHIQVMLLENGDMRYLNITVQDNGPGFSQGFLESQSNSGRREYDPNHIGLYNIRQRLFLMYGENAAIDCSNNESGACCEVFIPLKGGENHDSADC